MSFSRLSVIWRKEKGAWRYHLASSSYMWYFEANALSWYFYWRSFLFLSDKIEWMVPVLLWLNSEQPNWSLSWVSSQLVTWPTRNQVNPYPGSPLVTTFTKSTRNQSLGYDLTFQKSLRKTRTQTYSLSRYLYDYIYILFYIQRPVYVP